MPLKIYYRKDWLPEGTWPVQLLQPFLRLDPIEYNPDNLLGPGWHEFNAHAKEWLSLVPAEQAECNVMPLFVGRRDATAEERGWIAREKAAGRPTIAFAGGDSGPGVGWEDAVVLANNLYRSRMPARWRAMPHVVHVPEKEIWPGGWQPRPWQPIPVIGFTGFAPPLGLPWGKRRWRETARYLLYRAGLLPADKPRAAHAPRAHALQVLAHAQGVKLNANVRAGFAFAGPTGNLLPGGTQESAWKQRADYFANMAEADYVLCVRGFGNYSLRLYETLACGRLPLLVDTDLALPWPDDPRWERLCCRVPARDMANLGRRVRDFHASLTPEEFTKRQIEARNFFTERLSMAGFFSHLRELLPKP